MENLKSRHENEIRNLQEKLQTKEIEHVTTQAQRDAAEKRADQLMSAIRDMSNNNNSPADGPEQHEESPNQVLEDLRRKWNSEIKRLRDRIDTQNEQNRTLCSMFSLTQNQNLTNINRHPSKQNGKPTCTSRERTQEQDLQSGTHAETGERGTTADTS